MARGARGLSKEFPRGRCSPWRSHTRTVCNLDDRMLMRQFNLPPRLRSPIAPSSGTIST